MRADPCSHRALPKEPSANHPRPHMPAGVCGLPRLLRGGGGWPLCGARLCGQQVLQASMCCCAGRGAGARSLWLGQCCDCVQAVNAGVPVPPLSTAIGPTLYGLPWSACCSDLQRTIAPVRASGGGNAEDVTGALKVRGPGWGCTARGTTSAASTVTGGQRRAPSGALADLSHAYLLSTQAVTLPYIYACCAVA